MDFHLLGRLPIFATLVFGCFCRETTISTLEGSNVDITCSSSFPPPWTWFGPKDGQHRSLAPSGTRPHPKLNEPRYTFSKNGNNYHVQIINVKVQDAGKFVCDGDTSQMTLLNVMR